MRDTQPFDPFPPTRRPQAVRLMGRAGESWRDPDGMREVTGGRVSTDHRGWVPCRVR